MDKATDKAIITLVCVDKEKNVHDSLAMGVDVDIRYMDTFMKWLEKDIEKSINKYIETLKCVTKLDDFE